MTFRTEVMRDAAGYDVAFGWVERDTACPDNVDDTFDLGIAWFTIPCPVALSWADGGTACRDDVDDAFDLGIALFTIRRPVTLS